MKKVLCVIFSVIICVGLSACGNDTYTNTNTNTTSTRTCKFKEGNRYVCSSPCKSGSNFCSYHDKYLNDAYDAISDRYDSLN